MSNEHGGPTVELIMAIGCVFIIMTGIFNLGRNLYSYIYSIPGSKVGGYTIVAGYK